jgi:hypothetical protein
MTKPELKILERIFAAEISNLLPAQLKESKILLELEADGYVRRSTKVLGGRFPVTIKGWELTLLGNLAYCTSC